MEHQNRIEILNRIFGHFQQVTQWMPNHIDTASKYIFKAESLIEKLEIEDCGQIGGYDINNLPRNESGYVLYDRFLALVRKYNHESSIKPVCHFDLQTMKQYFQKLVKLHESSNK